MDASSRHSHQNSASDHRTATSADNLIEMATTNSSQNIAIQTIIQGLELDAVRNEGPHDTATLRTLAGHVVENAMIFGYVAWRPELTSISNAPDVSVPVIAAPGDVDIAWHSATSSAETGHWVPVASSRAHWLRGTKEWRLAVFDEPYRPDQPGFAAGGTPQAIPVSSLRSACARSYTAAARQQLIEHQWLTRDKFNSAPSAFTSIRRDFGNSDGKLRPWFRDVNAGTGSALHSASTLADTDNAQDFRALISNRADTIRQLSENTARERDSIARRTAIRDATTVRGKAEAAYGDVPSLHEEFAISDGKEIHTTPMLLSTIDGHLQFSRSRHTVFILMGVPPQAVGESVNSERNASNHRQYEVAMALFTATLRRFRVLVNNILESSGCNAEFVAALPIHTLESIGPVMKTSALKRRFAETHNIDEVEVDPARLKKWQDSCLAENDGAAATETENSDPDVRQSTLDKKKAKRNKTEPVS